MYVDPRGTASYVCWDESGAIDLDEWLNRSFGGGIVIFSLDNEEWWICYGKTSKNIINSACSVGAY